MSLSIHPGLNLVAKALNRVRKVDDFSLNGPIRRSLLLKDSGDIMRYALSEPFKGKTAEQIFGVRTKKAGGFADGIIVSLNGGSECLLVWAKENRFIAVEYQTGDQLLNIAFRAHFGHARYTYSKDQRLMPLEYGGMSACASVRVPSGIAFDVDRLQNAQNFYHGGALGIFELQKQSQIQEVHPLFWTEDSLTVEFTNEHVLKIRMDGVFMLDGKRENKFLAVQHASEEGVNTFAFDEFILQNPFFSLEDAQPLPSGEENLTDFFTSSD
jgi:hypothetical protein